MDMLRRLSGEASPLHGAAGQGAADLLRVLIDSGADANARDKYGNTPLHLAVERGEPGCIVALLPQTAAATLDGCNRMGQAPLRIAVNNRHIGSVRLLLAAGADPDTPSPSHSQLKYPLGIALWDYDPEMVALLLQAGARPDGAYDALHSMYAVFEADKEDPDVVFRPVVRRRLLSIMLKHGLDPARTVPASRYGDTLRHALCRYGAPINDISLVLRYDEHSSANTKNADGDTPLQCYIKDAQTLRIGVVKALLEHGADATISDGNGKPLLRLLVRRGQVPGLRDMLVENGAHSDTPARPTKEIPHSIAQPQRTRRQRGPGGLEEIADQGHTIA